MELSEKQIKVIQQFLSTNEQLESYLKYFGSGNRKMDAVTACRWFKKPEVKRMVKLLREEREKAIIKATQDTYIKMYAEQIASELELDIFHTEVVRGKAEMEEVFAVREKTLVNRIVQGQVVPFMEEKVVFKRIKRAASIKERQVSASELYKRKGSYKGVAKVSAGQDDQQAAINSKGNENTPIERYAILSDGTKLPII